MAKSISLPGRTALARFRQAQLEEGKVKVGLKLPRGFSSRKDERRQTSDSRPSSSRLHFPIS